MFGGFLLYMGWMEIQNKNETNISLFPTAWRGDQGRGG